MIHKAKRLDNRGLTLVELLVAVIILGIIVSPLLHSFVTSAHTALKSRQYGDATAAAQNIIETIESTDTDVLLTDAASIGSGATFYSRTVTGGVVSYSVSATPAKDSNDNYYIGIPVSSGNSSYNALITLDASHITNDKPVTEYTELIATTQATGADNPDNVAKAEFDEAYVSNGGSNPTLERTITITIGAKTLDPDGIKAIYPVSILYSYDGGFNYGPGGASYQSFHSSSTSETSYTAFVGGIITGEPVFSMYFFFDSFYGYGSTIDNVIVYNNANNSGPGTYDLQFNLFLVRQKTGETATRDALYHSRIWQYENGGLGTDLAGNYLNACKIFTNMNTNLNTGNDITSFEYRVFPNNGTLWYNPGTAEPKLVESYKSDRLLYVNVQLFKSGSDFTDNAVASIDTTKLD